MDRDDGEPDHRAAREDRVLLNLIGWPAIVAAVFLGTGSASAHQLMGGNTLFTFANGLLSGAGHPIIGPDYLAFLLALGIAVGVFRLSFVNPFVFVAAMICGVGLNVAGLAVPGVDLIVSVSVLLAGLMLIIDERIPPIGWMAVFIAAGLIHGYSYGDAIYGAEPLPLVGYVIGLMAGWRSRPADCGSSGSWRRGSPARLSVASASPLWSLSSSIISEGFAAAIRFYLVAAAKRFAQS